MASPLLQASVQVGVLAGRLQPVDYVSLAVSLFHIFKPQFLQLI